MGPRWQYLASTSLGHALFVLYILGNGLIRDELSDFPSGPLNGCQSMSLEI